MAGRPPKLSIPRNRVISLRLSDQEHEEVKKLANDFGYDSVTDYLRDVAIYMNPFVTGNTERLEELKEMRRNIKDIMNKIGM